MAFVGKEAYRGPFGERPGPRAPGPDPRRRRGCSSCRRRRRPTPRCRGPSGCAGSASSRRSSTGLAPAARASGDRATLPGRRDGGAMSEPRQRAADRRGLRRRGRQGLRLGVERHRRPARPKPPAMVRDLPRRVRGAAAAAPGVPRPRDRRLAAVPRGRRRVPRLVAGQPRARLALPRGDHHGPRRARPARGGERRLRARASAPCAWASPSCSSRSSAA